MQCSATRFQQEFRSDWHQSSDQIDKSSEQIDKSSDRTDIRAHIEPRQERQEFRSVRHKNSNRTDIRVLCILILLYIFWYPPPCLHFCRPRRFLIPNAFLLDLAPWWRISFKGSRSAFLVLCLLPAFSLRTFLGMKKKDRKTEAKKRRQIWKLIAKGVKMRAKTGPKIDSAYSMFDFC